MIFNDTPIPGAFIIDLECQEDERGFFARSWCQREFEARGLNPRIVQCNISYNRRSKTLRGMHYQITPHEEVKLVRCTAGGIYDVIIDLRPDSPAFRQWAAFKLTSENRRMLYIPESVAHGFLTLEDGTEVVYQMSEFYSPDHARGVRWNDPAFTIEWPRMPAVISARDNSYADFPE